MDSFEDLGLGPELVEALLSEGVEVPSELQTHAIPVLRRGNPAVLRAGPGAGAMVAWAAPLLDRLTPGAGRPVALVLSPTRELAQEIARSLGRLGLVTGHRAAALGGAWALPAHADLLVGTPADVGDAVRKAELKLDVVEALVLDGAAVLLVEDAGQAVGLILDALETEDLQGIVVSDPVTGPVREWIREHLRKAVFLPPEAAGEDEDRAPVQRGVLRLLEIRSPGLERDVVPAVDRVLDDEVHHALVFFRSEDRAADCADLLTLHGYAAGSPGDTSTPVWLGLDPLEDRKAVEASGVDPEKVVTLSLDPPADVDTLDRRHGRTAVPGVLVALPREIPHLRRLAREAGYRLESMKGEADAGLADRIETFREEVEASLQNEDLAAYAVLLEPLLEEWTASEVAAALAAIVRREGLRRAPGTGGRAAAERESVRDRPPAWTRLFLSVGSRDGVGPGDLLGAITGEAGLTGDQVGRIDIRDTFSRVDVQDAQAEKVIRALNGISIRGRSVRADFDRGGRRG
jgi:ATP-dependent RNA helicase DeaD